MKKTLTLLSIFAFVCLFVSGTNAQIHTVKGDFYHITRTIEQTADSVTFVADTLTLADSGGGVANFLDGDSVVVFFTQNRFKIVNNMLTQTTFDYIRVRIGSTSTGMSLSHEAYTGVVVNTSLPLGSDPAVSNQRDIGIRPLYRYYGPIASSTVINGDPNTLRQMLAFRIQAPTNSADFIQMRNILFKPNINNLTGLATAPDTAKDTLRAYLLDGGSHGVGVGNVVGNILKNTPDGADLAIVRLLPGTTQFLVWVKDSAQAVDAGEFIGSFGDYSRGRYFLGDDGLPFNTTSLVYANFRPGQFRTFVGSPDPPVLNPDYGMQIDGMMPERNPLRLTKLYQTLAPIWYNEQFDANPYNVNSDPNYPGPNPNPQNGLIPPYRPGESNIAHVGRDYQPGLVSSAVDTLRFLDAYGNRTWDRQTQPTLTALAYTITDQTPQDATLYLKGQTSADDTLRQFGQIVYRRLAYTHADVGANQGAVQDSVRILASATVNYVDGAFIPRTLIAEGDTSGGFPRMRRIGGLNDIILPSNPNWVVHGWNGVDSLNYRASEAYSDEMGTTPQWNIPNRGRKDAGWWNVDGAVDKQNNPNGYRTAVDPAGINSLPNTGVKIVIRPNLPRAIDLHPLDQWKGSADNDFIRIDGVVVDGFGNTVDDNERFKLEQSPFGVLMNGSAYRLNGVFDSLVNPISPIVISGKLIDTGRVYVTAANIGHFTRVFRHASGSNSIGPYRIRVRASWCENDRGNDVNDPNKVDHLPGPGFSHSSNILDGSPNNNFGVFFGPGTGWNAGFGDNMGQTTAMDSTDVLWDGTNWSYCTGPQPRIEIVWGQNTAFVVGTVGTATDSIYEDLYMRISDIYGNPMDIAPFFNASPTETTVELPDNPLYYPPTGGSKHFYASVSKNIANSEVYGSTYVPPIAGNMDDPDPVATPGGVLLNAKLLLVPANTMLPGIEGDIVAPSYSYNVVQFYLRAPQNVSKLSLAGVDVVRMIAHLRNSNCIGGAEISVTSAVAEVSVIPGVVQAVEIFKSWGKPQGTTVPLGTWGPGTVSDRAAMAYPVGTPTGALADPTQPHQPYPSQANYNPTDNDMFYTGYFFRSTGANDPPSTAPDFPSVIEPMGYSDKGIGSFQASSVDLDHDATAPIPMDTVVVSNHTNQIRIMARVLDKFQNPVGGRLVRFFVESETIPVTPPKTRLQDNTQRGGFGNLGTINLSDDTLKRSTIGDTSQAGWVSAYFFSGRVGWQIVRIAVTPDTLAFDISNIGRNLGEGTPVGPSKRGFAPRVILPIYQRSDTTVKIELYTYAAASTSPIPLPADTLSIQTLENETGYVDGQDPNYAPKFVAFSANPLCQETRATHFNRVANKNILPYIPDSTQLVAPNSSDPMAVTAGRIVTVLAREYDQFGNLYDNSHEFDDTARVRFRIFGPNFGMTPAPYNGAGVIAGGSIAPAKDWTRDEYGPMRKARYRHTKVGNLVAGVHINQTGYCTALELPTPRTAATTLYVEGTGTAVLPNGLDIDPNISRDTVKIQTFLKNPTRMDIIRAGQVFGSMPQTQGGGPGVFALTGPPENRTVSANRNIGLPNGADQIHHSLDAQGYDDILLSQVYKKNVDPNSVGKYEVINNDNLPLDKNGNPLFLANGTFNPAFQRNPISGMPIFQKLDARNNENPQTAPNPSYNDLNNGTSIPGARRDGTMFDISIAGGGDGIGTDSWDGTRDRRPVLFILTPLWENKAPQDGPPYIVKNMPGQTRVYYNRLFSDSVYTFVGNLTPIKGQCTRIEFMGTRTDGGNPGFYEPTVDYNGTRIGVSYWAPADFTRSGYPKSNTIGNFRTATGASIMSGKDAMGNPLSDYNRRVALANWSTEIPGPSGQANAALTFCPGAFLKVIDSTAGQVIDVRVVDESLGIDDTVSWDSGKMTVIRRANRESNGYWNQDDTWYELALNDIPGPNQTAGLINEEPFSSGNRTSSGSAFAGIYYGTIGRAEKRNTFVIVPYRIAFLSIFPSSFNTAQRVNDLSTLSMGILPEQADIDTLPRISPTFYSDLYGTPINTFEIFTRLYGQIKEGSTTDKIPNNGTPYARPDTIFRDQEYVYAVTPYDRYGNMNTRDSMWIQVGARFTNDWSLSFSGASDGSSYLIRGGGNYFNAMPINFPSSTSTDLRQDTLYLYNLAFPSNGNRNDYLGIKPDDKRLHFAAGDVQETVGSGGSSTIYDGLIPANVMSSRPVWVKMPFAPAPFVLGTAAMPNRALFRLDHTGRCLDSTGASIDGLKNDILRLQWQSSQWQPPFNGQNNPNDTVKYEWYAIIDSVGSTTSASRTVSVMSDNNGVSPSLSLDGRSLYNLIFRPGYGPHPNQDSCVMVLHWFVRAFNKAGLETYSDTAGYTIRDNPPPTPPLVISINRAPTGAPNAISPADGSTMSGLSASSAAIPVVWSQSTDINNIKGALLGGPFMLYNSVTRAWEKDLNRTIDTIQYQWVGIVASTYPPGKGAPVGTTYVKSAAGTSAGITIDPSDLNDMFRTFNPDPTSTSADSVKITWKVYVKDFYYNDDLPLEAVNFPYKDGIWATESLAFASDTGRWSPFSCQPHILASNIFHLNLTKLDQGGVEFDAQYAGTPDINALVGDEICFDLVAKDKDGNIIRDWDAATKGSPVITLRFLNSTANTDTSKQSWNADPDGYTWARITYNNTPLTYDPTKDEFYVDPSDFVEGRARICLKYTKAESGVTLDIKDKQAFLTQQTSANMNFSVDAITNYLVELTPSIGGQTDPAVYFERRYEIVVSPRDRYLNVSNVMIRTLFSARFPGEFDNTMPGLANIFTGSVFITGPTNYFIASRFAREKPADPQWILAYSANDPTVFGQTNPYQVLNHAPTPFALQQPPDNTNLQLNAAADTLSFTWVKAIPQDPYTNIQISRFDPTTYSDAVTYDIRFVDAISLTRMIKFDSDQSGVLASYSTNEGQMAGIIDQMSGISTTKSYDVIWYVNATDGLYNTLSSPPYQDPQGRAGYRLTLTKNGILSTDHGSSTPTEYQLSQNYPNPFNPTTAFNYAMPKAGQVTIMVYDLLGSVVKTLVNQYQTEGSYKVTWDATNDNGQQVNSGNYIIKMVAGNFTTARKMTLMK